jgi:hypothetical protein
MVLAHPDLPSLFQPLFQGPGPSSQITSKTETDRAMNCGYERKKDVGYVGFCAEAFPIA